MFTDSASYNRDLFAFLNESPTAFQVVETIKKHLTDASFTVLDETGTWDLKPGGRYIVIRENSSLIAFSLSQNGSTAGFNMVASHSDSPGLQLKPVAGVEKKPYLQLGVEVYGGPLLNQWFDRDLSIAGRVSMEDGGGGYKEYLLDFKRPLITIPTLAIHLDRSANEKKSVDKQKDLQPILAQIVDDQLPDFSAIIRDQLVHQYPEETFGELISFDLFCYDCQPPAHIGLNREFISGPRLDNQLSCHAATRAIAESSADVSNMFICYNHEENGSNSSTGAHSSFLSDTLTRIIPDQEKRLIALRHSLLISADNAHAVHPNFTEKSEPNHRVDLNSGVVLKINANQRYSTNCRTSAQFKLLAKAAGVAVQEFVMRSDMPCGSTVGPITAAKLGVETVDVGAPTFCMHSIRELTGSEDPYMMYRVLRKFFN